jgi:hypothetical protein
MKLIFCPKCQDVVNLLTVLRRCRCTSSWGAYHDDVRAYYGGEAIPIGFENPSLIQAIRDRPKTNWGSNFEAFVVPFDCPTFRQVGEHGQDPWACPCPKKKKEGD